MTVTSGAQENYDCTTLAEENPTGCTYPGLYVLSLYAHRIATYEPSCRPVSRFARGAAEEKADRIIREHEATTTAPAEFFDELLAALEAPATPNAVLTRTAKRARTVVTRD